MPPSLRSLFRRAKGKAAIRRPALEALEDRSLPSVFLPNPGEPGTVYLVGTDGPDKFSVGWADSASSGPALRVSADGVAFEEAPLAHVKDIVVLGLAGDDRLTVDNTGGLVARPDVLGIVFLGGKGSDELRLWGKPGTAIKQFYTNLEAAPDVAVGLLASYDPASSQGVLFAELESVVDTMAAGSLAIRSGDGADALFIADGDVNGQMATMRVTSEGSFVPISFAGKTDVLIETMGGDDAVTFDATKPAAGLQSLSIDGGAGFDTVAMMTHPDLAMFLAGFESKEDPRE